MTPSALSTNARVPVELDPRNVRVASVEQGKFSAEQGTDSMELGILRHQRIALWRREQSNGAAPINLAHGRRTSSLMPSDPAAEFSTLEPGIRWDNRLEVVLSGFGKPFLKPSQMRGAWLDETPLESHQSRATPTAASATISRGCTDCDDDATGHMTKREVPWTLLREFSE